MPASVSPPKNTAASHAFAILRIVLVAGIFAFLAWRIASDWNTVERIELSWNWLYLSGAFVSGFLAYQCLLLGWMILLRRLGFFRIQHVGIYSRIWWASYLYRYIPGKIFLLVERARLGLPLGIPAATGTALAIVETLFSIMAAAWVSLLSVSYYAVNSRYQFLDVVLITIAVLFVLPYGYRFFASSSFVKGRFPELTAIDLKTRDVLFAMPAFLLHFLLLGFSFFLILQCFGDLELAMLPGICGVYAMSHMIGILAIFSPGGLGVRESVLTFQLTRIYPGGAAEIVALSARLWFTFVELLAYSIMMVACPKQPPSDDSRSRKMYRAH